MSNQPESTTDSAADALLHDLNNVFTTILDSSALLATDPQWTGLARILERNVARGRRIIEEFFEAGGESGRAVLEAVVASAIEFSRDSHRAAGVEFRSSLQPGIVLRGSHTSWERALFNLLINAAQSCEEGRGTVEIRAHQAGGSVEITVLDDGIGIPEHALPLLFEPGFSTKPEHAGLGLHIVGSIVAAHGGTITASPRQDARGSLIRIVLPAA